MELGKIIIRDRTKWCQRGGNQRSPYGIVWTEKRKAMENRQS